MLSSDHTNTAPGSLLPPRLGDTNPLFTCVLKHIYSELELGHQDRPLWIAIATNLRDEDSASYLMSLSGHRLRILHYVLMERLIETQNCGGSANMHRKAAQLLHSHLTFLNDGLQAAHVLLFSVRSIISQIGSPF